MQFKNKFLLDGTVISFGQIYPDGWITSEVKIDIFDIKENSILKISLWNPDISSVFFENSLAVSYGAHTKVARNLRMGQVVDIEIDPSGFPIGTVSIKIDKSLSPSKFDNRERAATIVEMRWLK
jgi:hypothetical protein